MAIKLQGIREMNYSEQNTPAERNDHIGGLFHDHDLVLLFCRKVRRGLENEVELERLKNYINFFWDSHLKAHFLNEEVLLFNRFEDELVIHAKKGHQQIVNQIDMILKGNNNGPHAYYELLEMLIFYVRFEEHHVFPHLEKLLSTATLHAVSHFLEKGYSTDLLDTYSDTFWLDKKPRTT